MSRWTGASIQSIIREELKPYGQARVSMSGIDVRLPASLALTGKALAQMQLATAALDPTLDPFSVAGRFLTRTYADRLRHSANPTRVLYEGRPTSAAAVAALAWTPWAWAAQAMTLWSMMSLSMLSSGLPRRN